MLYAKITAKQFFGADEITLVTYGPIALSSEHSLSSRGGKGIKYIDHAHARM